MDDLLDAAAERANTAQMIFTLIDSEGAGTVPIVLGARSRTPINSESGRRDPLDGPNFRPRRASPRRHPP